MSTIKKSAQEFLSKEKRLDVLWNNAGLMGVSKDANTKQVRGHSGDLSLLLVCKGSANLISHFQGQDLVMGTNCYGPVLFTQLLHPLLVATAQSSPAASVRVIWMGSIVIHLQAPKSGMDLENLDFKKKDESPAMRYAISKTGDLFIAAEWARRDAQVGIVHLVSEIDQLRS
jgi:retinol dehydrogenase-12